jgi:hypothetical protein
MMRKLTSTIGALAILLLPVVAQAEVSITINEQANHKINGAPAPNTTWLSYITLENSEFASRACQQILKASIRNQQSPTSLQSSWPGNMLSFNARHEDENWIIRAWWFPNKAEDPDTVETEELGILEHGAVKQMLGGLPIDNLDSFECHPPRPGQTSGIVFMRSGRADKIVPLFDSLDRGRNSEFN